jgi:hypothetical protein
MVGFKKACISQNDCPGASLFAYLVAFSEDEIISFLLKLLIEVLTCVVFGPF